MAFKIEKLIRMNMPQYFLIFFLYFSLTTPLKAGEVQVAVSANFAAPMKKISAAFEQTTGHKALLSFGSTGKLYAQIINAAPFDVLLAADQEVPNQLIQRHAGVKASQFTYAVGKLVLWSGNPNLVDSQGAILKRSDFNHLAIASPTQAAYGKAALEMLNAWNLISALSPKIVQGESISQAYMFVATGNAELGLVALSQLQEGHEGSAWIVPQHLYTPLRQDALLLKRGVDNPAALALLNFLKSDVAKQIIQSYGYDLPR